MKEYTDLHNELIQKLRELGVYHSYKDRLQLAWYKHRIAKVTVEDVTYIRELIDKLIVLRREGLEPAHKGERYI